MLQTSKQNLILFVENNSNEEITRFYLKAKDKYKNKIFLTYLNDETLMGKIVKEFKDFITILW